MSIMPARALTCALIAVTVIATLTACEDYRPHGEVTGRSHGRDCLIARCTARWGLTLDDGHRRTYVPVSRRAWRACERGDTYPACKDREAR